MRMIAACLSAVLVWSLGVTSRLAAQPVGGSSARTTQAAQVAAAQASPAPATKLEAFKPAAGSVVTFGYDELGGVFGVAVDVREIRDAKGAVVRGLLVEVTESQYRKETSFVDADEIPELLKGFDAILEVKANPTEFKNFEVRYTTRGELQVTAYNNSKGEIKYAIQAGRGMKARQLGIGAIDIQNLRATFEAALQKLSSLPAK